MASRTPILPVCTVTCDPNNLNKRTYLCRYFGSSVGGSKGNYGLTMEGDELVFAADSDAYKEGLKFLNSVYAEVAVS